MNVLITGATSFLGAETARAFLGAGCDVWAPVRPSSKRLGFLPVHERLHRVDIDMNEISRLPETGIPSPEVCVHFAWSGEGVRGRMDPEIQEQNVRNTLALIRVMGEMGCRRFLFAGSQAEYGVTLERVEARKMSPAAAAEPEVFCTGAPVREEAPCHPISEYGKGKLRILKEGRELAECLRMEYIHMRIFSVYGEGDHETSLVSSCVRAAKEGRTAELGPCRQQWNFLHVKDCAEAVLTLAEYAPAVEPRCDGGASGAGDTPGVSGACGVDGASGSCIYNIGSFDTRPLREFVQEVFDIAASCGYDGAGFRLEEREAGPEGTPYLSPDIEKVCAVTGWKPRTSFAEGIRGMLLK